MNELAAASCVILAGTAGGYYYIYRLHGRRFFAYVSAAWLVNLAYILLERWVTRAGREGDFSVITATSALTFVGTIFFFFALADLRRMAVTTVKQVILASVAVVVAAFIAGVTLVPQWRAEVLTAGVAVLTAAGLIALAVATLRMRSEDWLLLARNERPADHDMSSALVVHRAAMERRYDGAGVRRVAAMPADALRALRLARALVGGTLLLYGVLQPFYPARWWLAANAPAVLASLFWLSLVAKAAHGFAVPLLVLAELKCTAEALRERSVAEELGVLTASIEHDIKSPLALIHKDIDNIKAQFQHVKPLTERLNRLLAHAERIGAAASVIPATREMVEHFQQFAEVINVVSVARDAIAAVKKIDRRGDIRVVFESSRSELLIFGDKARLMQAFVNIINNGVEAAREKHETKPPVIEVTCWRHPDLRRCCVSITDNGGGISADNLAKIGRPFFSTKTARRGNRGIGVFMADRVMRLHGGAITFASDGRSYTTVSIQLPLRVHDKETTHARDGRPVSATA
jgi:signal transduction histidine kinase